MIVVIVIISTSAYYQIKEHKSRIKVSTLQYENEVKRNELLDLKKEEAEVKLNYLKIIIEKEG